MKVKVFAKLNLSLNVFPNEGNFHPIDSIALSVNLWDDVSVKAAKTKAVTLRGCKDIPLEKNSAYNAACAFVQRFDTNGCNILIKKHIPQGCGLGGSSADAAAVVACMCRLYDVDKNSLEVAQLCAELGSDVNFMLHGGMSRMRGKGDDLEFLANYPKLFFALTLFDSPLSTAQVYSQFDQLGKNGVLCDNDLLSSLLQQEQTKQALPMFSNGLQQAAESLLPQKTFSEVARYKKVCASCGFSCHQTGSGSAYFVAFATKEEADFATKLLKAEKFDTLALSYVAWGVETSNFFFKVV